MRSLATLLFLIVAAFVTAAGAAERPNVIVIMADDK